MNQTEVLAYKCPCCGAQLTFSTEQQSLECEYCGNSFEAEAVKECNEPLRETGPEFQWEEVKEESLSEEQTLKLLNISCPSCGGRIMSDANTAAAFCPYCDNPAIVTERVSGELKPGGIIPFQKTREDAQNAFKELCKGKKLLPKDFLEKLQIEKLAGIYVPFWLYSCGGQQAEKYRCTRIHTWSDSRYNYTKTDYFLANRAARANFKNIPMDASSKIDNVIMESIEPFDYSQLTDFNCGYLSGFLADKYDVKAAEGEDRIRERVSQTMDAEIQASLAGYMTTTSTEKRLEVGQIQSKYVLLPVWMLHTTYEGQRYIFAMNGQTGKMTGSFPICSKKSKAWFWGVFAAVFSVIGLLPLLFL